MVTIRHNTGTTRSFCAIIETSHNMCYSTQHLEKKCLSRLNKTLLADQCLHSVGEHAGKQKGNPGQEYLGYITETEALSESAAALFGFANLL